MKRLLIIAFLFSSCITRKVTPISTIFDPYLGKTEHQVIMKLGTPTSSVSDGAGGKVLRYSEESMTTSHYNPITKNQPAKSFTKFNERYMEFFISPRDSVYNWRTNYPDIVEEKLNMKTFGIVTTFTIMGLLLLLMF